MGEKHHVLGVGPESLGEKPTVWGGVAIVGEKSAALGRKAPILGGEKAVLGLFRGFGSTHGRNHSSFFAPKNANFGQIRPIRTYGTAAKLHRCDTV